MLPAQGSYVIQDARKGGHDAPGGALFQEMQKSQAVVAGRTGKAALEDILVADLFPDGDHAPEGQPYGGVEPVEDLNAGKHPIQRDVRPFDVGKFMEK